MLHRVVAHREAHRAVALHRHGDRRPHGARQRDLDHRQPIGGQPRPAMENGQAYVSKCRIIIMPEEYGMLSKTGLITLPCGECVPIGRKKLNTGYGTMGCTTVLYNYSC